MMRGSFILNGLTEPNKAKKEEEKQVKRIWYGCKVFRSDDKEINTN